MRVFVSALVLLALVIVYGCENNDNNTVNAIPKYHSVYPAFQLKVDNGYRTFGLDSARLTVTPSVGWPEPIYSDNNGFLGTLASGTFIVTDTTILPDSTVQIDTLSIDIYGFLPSQTYQFAFSQDKPFIWRDSFRADFVTTVDSQWILLGADTLKYTNVMDPANPPESVLYRVVKNPSGPQNPPPTRIDTLNLLYGAWFDSLFVVTDSAATAAFPPDSFKRMDVRWAYWYRVDTSYLPPDPEIWCDSIDSIESDTTYITPQGDTLTNRRTVIVYSACDPHMDTTRVRIYRYYGWGTYTGSGQAVTRFDTTVHFSFPDTAKSLVVTPDGLTIYTLEISPDSIDTVMVDTSGADINFIRNGDTTAVNNMVINLTMPPVEVFPSYRYIIKQRP